MVDAAFNTGDKAVSKTDKIAAFVGFYDNRKHRQWKINIHKNT